MNKRNHLRTAGFDRLKRPGLGALLTYILHGVLSSIVFIPVILLGLATVMFHVNELPYREYMTLALLATIGIAGLWRGCSDWQQARADYQRELARMRHKVYREKNAPTEDIPGFIPFYRN